MTLLHFSYSIYNFYILFNFFMQTFFCDKLSQKLRHIRWSRNKKALVAYENGPAKKLSKTAAFLTPSNTEGN